MDNVLFNGLIIVGSDRYNFASLLGIILMGILRCHNSVNLNKSDQSGNIQKYTPVFSHPNTTNATLFDSCIYDCVFVELTSPRILLSQKQSVFQHYPISRSELSHQI
jgi:hypothetical protein